MSSLSVSEQRITGGPELASDDSAISVEELSVTYRTTIERKPTLRGRLARLGRRQRIVREIRALREVSFAVPHGMVLGIVGVNGAGKSTLMRTIAGILPPTSGRVQVHGRVSTLLALGVGFNADLSGRENVVLGGLAAGLSRAQLAAKYDEIADFAELGGYGAADAPLLLGHVRAARVLGRRQHGARHPAHRRGALGGRSALPAQVVQAKMRELAGGPGPSSS